MDGDDGGMRDADATRAEGTRNGSDSYPSPARAYGVVVVATASYTCLTFVWFTLPAYLPTIIADVGLTATRAGVLAGAVPLTYIPLALFSGLAVDRVGPARSLAAGVGILGLAQVGRSAAEGFPGLLAFTLLLGVGGTAVTFGLPKLVSVLFPPDRTGLPSSVYLIGSSAGTAAAFAVGRPVLGPMLGGWRPLFRYSGAAAVAYAAAWLLAAEVIGLGGRTAGSPALTPDSLRRDVRAILGHRRLRLVVVIGTTYLLVIHGLQGWLPTLLESRGMAAEPAGRTTSLLVAASVVGILTVPAAADRLSARPEAVMGCGALVCAGVLAVLAGGAGRLAVGGVVVAGVGVGGLSPLIRAIPPDLEGIGPELTGAAVGFVFAVGEIGGFLGPVLVGWLRDLTGSFAPGLGLLAAGGLAAAAAGYRMRPSSGR